MFVPLLREDESKERSTLVDWVLIILEVKRNKRVFTSH